MHVLGEGNAVGGEGRKHPPGWIFQKGWDTHPTGWDRVDSQGCCCDKKTKGWAKNFMEVFVFISFVFKVVVGLEPFLKHPTPNTQG